MGRPDGDSLAPPSTAHVEILRGSSAGERFPLGDLFTIGRGETCDLPLRDELASRNHACIERKGGAYVIRDFGSKNGTRVNGRAVSTQLLVSGDRIEVGHTMLFYQAPFSGSMVSTVSAPPTGIPVKGAAPAEEAPSRGRTPQVRRPARAVEPSAMPVIVGESAAIRKVLATVDEVARTDATVLVLGETGTGKELVARAVHHRSPRRAGPFVAVNCAALPESLLESELFGHEKGAFTGAGRTRPGRFEEADGGTLFLDEIGEMSAAVQAKLLRVLEEKRVTRVGGTGSLPVDIRIVCATNRDLENEVEAGRFRRDLYFRIHVLPVRIPPLRERREDVPLLVAHFLDRAAAQSAKPAPKVSDDALEALARYDWPGNVRELENLVVRASILGEGETLSVRDFLPADDGTATPTGAPPAGLLEAPYAEAKENFVRHYLEALLSRHDGNVSQAAREAGISRQALHRLINKLIRGHNT